jgi:hypothetical protein
MTIGTRRAPRVPLVAAAAIALLVGTTTSASAAPDFSITTGTVFTDGKAHTQGTIVWRSQRRATVDGRVRDICPTDGYGAYIEVNPIFANGRFGALKRRGDTNGCGPNATSIAAMTFNTERRIHALFVCAVEIDMNGGPTYGDQECRRRNNPRVG